MMNVTTRIRHLSYRELSAVRPAAKLGSRWVETADERCPLACIWFALSARLYLVRVVRAAFQSGR